MKIAKDQMLAIVLNKIVGKNIKIIDEILLNFLGQRSATGQGGLYTFFISFCQGPLRRCSLPVSSPVQCFSPGCRFEKAFFVVSRLDSKGANDSNLSK